MSRTTWVSWYQKGKTSLGLLEQKTVSGNGISWAICKSAPCPRQVTMPAPYHWVFTGRMPFLPPNQQHQNTQSIKAIVQAAVMVTKVDIVPLISRLWVHLKAGQPTPDVHKQNRNVFQFTLKWVHQLQQLQPCWQRITTVQIVCLATLNVLFIETLCRHFACWPFVFRIN